MDFAALNPSYDHLRRPSAIISLMLMPPSLLPSRILRMRSAAARDCARCGDEGRCVRSDSRAPSRPLRILCVLCDEAFSFSRLTVSPPLCDLYPSWSTPTTRWISATSSRGTLISRAGFNCRNKSASFSQPANCLISAAMAGSPVHLAYGTTRVSVHLLEFWRFTGTACDKGVERLA